MQGFADPHHFNAHPDPAFHCNVDPDPAFHFNADPGRDIVFLVFHCNANSIVNFTGWLYSTSRTD